MERIGHTRRGFLRLGAGAALGLAAAGGAGVSGARAQAGRPAARPDVLVGELRLFAGDYVPKGWLATDGLRVETAGNRELARALGDRWGRAPSGQLELPDLRGRALVGAGDPPGGPDRDVGDRGRGLVERNPVGDPSTLALTYLIAPDDARSRPLVGEVRAFAFGFAPREWLPCEGQDLRVGQYPALFAVLGTAFGGDGFPSFGIPDLRSFTPTGSGAPPEFAPSPFGTRRGGLQAGRDERRPRLHLNYCISLRGEFPDRPDR